MSEHQYASTSAAQMLAHGLRSASQERGTSLREIGRRLKYKQPVVLSHMATGRVPIPLDRAAAIARSRVALDELLVEGITTNVSIHQALLGNEAFLEGKMTTNLLDRVGAAAFLAAAGRP